MRIRLFIAALLVCVAAFAQQSVTVDQLVAFMRSAIQTKQQDKAVAEYVKRMKLTQKLSDSVIEQLQTEGLGPKTVAALRVLASESASLPAAEMKKVEPPAPKPEEPPPSPEEQKKILAEARDYALNYSKSLPNFICAQYTRQFDNERQYGSVLAKLTYFEQHEKYDTITVNDKPTNQTYDSLKGSISTGEFGSMLRGIFEPSTDAQFSWCCWRTIHGNHKAYVFRFSVDQPHSAWMIEDRDSHDKIEPAYNGFIFIDTKDNTILRFMQEAVDLPSTFRVSAAKTQLDYDIAEISGVPFVLPSKAVMDMKSGRDDQRNEITFHHYQKYSADATLSFGDIAPDNAPASEPKKPQ